MTARSPTFSPASPSAALGSKAPGGIPLDHSGIEGEQLAIGDRVYLTKPLSFSDFHTVASYGVLVDFDPEGNPIVLWDGTNGLETFYWDREDGNTVQRATRGTVIGAPVTWKGIYGEIYLGHVVSVHPHSFTVQRLDGRVRTIPYTTAYPVESLRFP